MMVRRLVRQVVQRGVLPLSGLFTGFGHPFEKTPVVFQAVVEPIVFVGEADEQSRRFPVPRDEHLVLRRLPHIAGQVVFHGCQGHSDHNGSPN